MPGADRRDAAAGLEGPPYPEQPVDGERPVPLRGRPERTQDQSDWDSASTEPISPRGPDQGGDELARRTSDERRAHADGSSARDRSPASDDESSYSTEQEQGAAQPGPDGTPADA